MFYNDLDRETFENEKERKREMKGERQRNSLGQFMIL